MMSLYTRMPKERDSGQGHIDVGRCACPEIVISLPNTFRTLFLRRCGSNFSRTESLFSRKARTVADAYEPEMHQYLRVEHGEWVVDLNKAEVDA